jgi:hypothetical protein
MTSLFRYGGGGGEYSSNPGKSWVGERGGWSARWGPIASPTEKNSYIVQEAQWPLIRSVRAQKSYIYRDSIPVPPGHNKLLYHIQQPNCVDRDCGICYALKQMSDFNENI